MRKKRIRGKEIGMMMYRKIRQNSRRRRKREMKREWNIKKSQGESLGTDDRARTER